MDIKERSVRYCVLLRIEATPTPTPVPVPVPATAPAPTSDSGVKEEAEPIIDQAANRKGGISNWRIEEMEALKEGYRTPDIYSDGLKKVTTSKMGEIIAERI